MEPQGNIPHCVGKITGHDAPFAMTRVGDLRNVEYLAGRVVHSAKKDESDGLSFSLDESVYVFISNAKFSTAWRDLQ